MSSISNRIKIVLLQQGKTNKWLADKINRDQATISKWCTNTSQPPLVAFVQIAQTLNVKMEDLIYNSQER